MKRFSMLLFLLAGWGCGNTQTDQYQQAIVGKWGGEATDSKGVKYPSELVFERFTPSTGRQFYHGRVYASVVTKRAEGGMPGEAKTASGKYTIEGKKLTLYLNNLGKEETREYTITELDDDYLVIVNDKREESVYRKKQ